MNQKASSEALKAMLTKAKGKLAAARRELKMGTPEEAVSRAYYAAFHAISAVLASQGFSFSSHAQTIGGFNAHFVRTGLFPKDTNRILHRLFENRQTADYDWTTVVERASAQRDVKDAAALVAACQAFLKCIDFGSTNPPLPGLGVSGDSAGHVAETEGEHGVMSTVASGTTRRMRRKTI